MALKEIKEIKVTRAQQEPQVLAELQGLKAKLEQRVQQELG